MAKRTKYTPTLKGGKESCKVNFCFELLDQFEDTQHENKFGSDDLEYAPKFHNLPKH